MARGVNGATPQHALVLGASGLLGHVVFDELVDAGLHVTGVMRRDRSELDWWPPFGEPAERAGVVDRVDATDWPGLRDLLDERRPDAVVNCVGVTPRRAQASDPVEVIRLNALLPHLLASWAAASGSRLITVSTDCVFGHRPGGFTETDQPTAGDSYGASKALGEVDDGAAVTIRTSFIGRELVARTELLEWFLANAGGTVHGFADVWYSGVPVGTMAAVVRMLATSHRHVTGVHHLAASEPISKLDLLGLANEAFGAGVTIVPDTSVTSRRTLDGRRLRAVLPVPPFDWADALATLAADRRYDRRPDRDDAGARVVETTT